MISTVDTVDLDCFLYFELHDHCSSSLVDVVHGGFVELVGLLDCFSTKSCIVLMMMLDLKVRILG